MQNNCILTFLYIIYSGIILSPVAISSTSNEVITAIVLIPYDDMAFSNSLCSAVSEMHLSVTKLPNSNGNYVAAYQEQCHGNFAATRLYCSQWNTSPNPPTTHPQVWAPTLGKVKFVSIIA